MRHAGLFYSQQQCRRRDMGVLGVPYLIFKYPDLGHPNSVADLEGMVWKRVAREGVSGMLNLTPSNHLIRPPTFTDLTWL